MINSFKNYIELALNKNQLGKPSPSDFNHALAESCLKLYSGLFSDFRKMNFKRSRFQDTPNYGNEAGIIKQCLEWYITEISVENGLLPSDFFAINSLFGKYGEIEKVDMQTFNLLKRSNKMKPSECNAIYTLNSSLIKTFPEVLNLEIVYYRKLKMPKWTYRIISGIETFDPDKSDYQDLDIHPLMYHQLFIDTLGLLGLNIKEELAVQYVAQMKQETMQDSQ